MLTFTHVTAPPTAHGHLRAFTSSNLTKLHNLKAVNMYKLYMYTKINIKNHLYNLTIVLPVLPLRTIAINV